VIHGSIWEEFKHKMQESDNILFKLIAVNVLVSLVFAFIGVLFWLFNVNFDLAYFIGNWLAVPSDPLKALYKPWTFITYQFMHAGLLHILFNMIILFWSGRIFREFLGNRRLLSTYFLGGISGAIIYILAYNFFPALATRESIMVGASASVFAILVGIATLVPNYQVFFIFIGPVRLKYIVLVLIILDILRLSSPNAGGHFAHLGGAFYGYLFVSMLDKGKDIGAWCDNLIDRISALFAGSSNTGSSFKVHHNKKAKQDKRGVDQAEIDKILDKIAASGYSSLSAKEKDTLFRASKEKQDD
jgi:membrane associated rhomboid family serine protease